MERTQSYSRTVHRVIRKLVRMNGPYFAESDHPECHPDNQGVLHYSSILMRGVHPSLCTRADQPARKQKDIRRTDSYDGEAGDIL